MNRIKELRIRKGLSQIELAKALDVTQGAVSQWEVGRSGFDKYQYQIAEYFGVSVEYLRGETSIPNDSRDHSTKRGVSIPVLGSIRAGIPVAAIEDVLDWEEIPNDMAKRGDYVGLLVKGNSMYPEIKDGDVAIIRRQEDVESGEIAAVFLNGEEATIKKIKKTNSGIMLIGLNAAEYEPHFYTDEEIVSLPVRIYGKLVEVRRKY